MKKLKILLPLLALSACIPAGAELYPALRFVEFGVTAEALATQNAIGVLDIFQETIVIDTEEISKNTGESGIDINVAVDSNLFLDFNIGKFSLGLNADLGFNADFSTGKGFVDFLAEGNPDGDVTSEFAMTMDSFFTISAPVKFFIANLGIHVTPKFYIPLVYMPRTTAEFFMTSDSEATFIAEAQTDFSFYVAEDLSSVFDESFGFLGFGAFIGLVDDVPQLIQSLAKKGGIALGLEAEVPVFRTLDVGVYADIPLTAGLLDYKFNGSAYVKATVDPVLTSLSSGEGVSTSVEKEFVFNGCEAASFKVREPLRFGLEAAWRPFGKWCTFRPLFGFAYRNPFGEDFDSKYSVYPEYKFSAEMAILYLLHLNFSTEYLSQVFAQRFGVGINMRLLQIDLNVSSASTSFAKSWSLAGVKANVGISMGF